MGSVGGSFEDEMWERRSSCPKRVCNACDWGRTIKQLIKGQAKDNFFIILNAKLILNTC
jgi:hypothetical protein